jgi:hypothetical protein
MIADMRERTHRPFAVNHTWRPLSEEAFRVTLDARPAVISLALGGPGDLPARAHDAGVRFMAQVHTVEQAVRAASAQSSSTATTPSRRPTRGRSAASSSPRCAMAAGTSSSRSEGRRRG